MARYVAVKLLKRYRSPTPTSHPLLQEKHKLFTRVLKGMTAADQPYSAGSVSDYTRLWSELIDRGGLYHINDEVSYEKNYYFNYDCLFHFPCVDCRYFILWRQLNLWFGDTSMCRRCKHTSKTQTYIQPLLVKPLELTLFFAAGKS